MFARSRPANRHHRSVRIIGALILLAAGLGAMTGSAGATAPGTNGKIAFDSYGANNIGVVDADGNNLVQLTHDEGNNFTPAWSPDGTKIAFFSNRDGPSYDIYVMDANGSNVTRLTTNAADERLPAWSPDGTEIAFERANLAATCDLGFGINVWKMDANGANQTQVTTSDCDSAPSWSPDGTKIAYFGDHDNTDATLHSDIFTSNPDGTGEFSVTNDGLNDNNPDWSPDGTKIVFDKGGEIYTIHPNGTGLNPITSNAYPDMRPKWAPNGQAFAMNSSAPTFGAWTMDTSGGNYFKVVSSYAADPDWQPIPQAPDTSIDSGPSGIDPSNGPTFTFSSAAPGATFECDLDAGGYSACTSPHSLVGLADGSHDFSVRAVNLLGMKDAAPATRTWTVDTTGAQPDGLVKLPVDAVSVGDGVYNSDGSGQTRLAKIHPGTTGRFDVEIQNDGVVTDSFTVDGCAGSRKFTVRYFDGVTDVTTAVAGGTYPLANLAPAGSAALRTTIHAKSTAKKGTTSTCLLVTTSQTTLTKSDAVGMKVKVIH